jgi:hypothetical protein
MSACGAEWHVCVLHLPVEGHKSILAFGLMGTGEGVPVVAMLGRVRSLGLLSLIEAF